MRCNSGVESVQAQQNRRIIDRVIIDFKLKLSVSSIVVQTCQDAYSVVADIDFARSLPWDYQSRRIELYELSVYTWGLRCNNDRINNILRCEILIVYCKLADSHLSFSCWDIVQLVGNLCRRGNTNYFSWLRAFSWFYE